MLGARSTNQHICTSLAEQQLYGRQVHTRPFYQEFTSDVERDPTSGVILTNSGRVRLSPVFFLDYAKQYYKFLASADEEGYISIIDTSQPIPTQLDDEDIPSRCRAQWLAHRNAIFDFCWTKNDLHMYTAGGDQTIALWDTSYASKISDFRGHTGSVKALSVAPDCHNVVVSGSRDGDMMLWDARASNNYDRNSIPPMITMHEPHRPKETRRASRSTLCGKPRPSITAVQFLPETVGGSVVASAGVDGIVKFWDLRRTKEAVNAIPAALDTQYYTKDMSNNPLYGTLTPLTNTGVPRLGVRDHGITSLALHPETCQLLVGLTGGHLLIYDGLRPDIGPTHWFGGHTVSSFYVKAAFSTDGSHVVSGSSDGDTYVWQVDGPDAGTRPCILKGHEGEVTSAAWCPMDACQLASSADDCTIRVWNVARAQKPEVRDPKPVRVPGGRWWGLVDGSSNVDNNNHQGLMMAPRHGDDDALIAAATPGNAGITTHINANTANINTNAARVALQTAAPPHSTPAPARRMVVSNALKRSVMKTKKRTIQQTLVQALKAGGQLRAGGAAKKGKRNSDSSSADSLNENMGGNNNNNPVQ